MLVEATVKDAAGHSETRGEPITVSESPLLLTAVPEGGTLIPGLENQVFILAAYPDGSPATRILSVNAPGAGRSVSTDESGVAVISLRRRRRRDPPRGSHRSGGQPRIRDPFRSTARNGADQILLRTDRAVYHAGDRIQPPRVFHQAAGRGVPGCGQAKARPCSRATWILRMARRN